mmetsp:Transcript_20736/g.41058  ORF Transcript_20736/g.41058 Transcript_20736/m.41058 type:complete len:226 (+) Transcript_20736:1296-1973(+)
MFLEVVFASQLFGAREMVHLLPHQEFAVVQLGALPSPQQVPVEVLVEAGGHMQLLCLWVLRRVVGWVTRVVGQARGGGERRLGQVGQEQHALLLRVLPGAHYRAHQLKHLFLLFADEIAQRGWAGALLLLLRKDWVACYVGQGRQLGGRPAGVLTGHLGGRDVCVVPGLVDSPACIAAAAATAASGAGGDCGGCLFLVLVFFLTQGTERTPAAVAAAAHCRCPVV